MKKVYAGLLFLLFISQSLAGESIGFQADFDHGLDACVHAALLTRPNIAIGKFGKENGNGLRVNYIGYPKGSHGAIFTCPLAKDSNAYTLEFDVKFSNDFQFVKGGKLHGLGPKKVMSGGNGISPNGWSARVVFRRNGGVGIYYYHQDQIGRYGDSTIAKDFRFELGRFYRVRMQVQLNSESTANDGMMKLFIDNRLVVEKNDIRFHSVTDRSALISKILFSTFHGGSTPDWAPIGTDGAYTTVVADFDDFVATSD